MNTKNNQIMLLWQTEQYTEFAIYRVDWFSLI